jgi:hypothetical protein
MPTYTCTTMTGRLSEEQRQKVVESITFGWPCRVIRPAYHSSLHIGLDSLY